MRHTARRVASARGGGGGYLPWGTTSSPILTWLGGRDTYYLGRGRGVPTLGRGTNLGWEVGGTYLGVPPPPSWPGWGEGVPTLDGRVPTLGYAPVLTWLGRGGTYLWWEGTYLEVPPLRSWPGWGRGYLPWMGEGVLTSGYPCPDLTWGRGYLTWTGVPTLGYPPPSWPGWGEGVPTLDGGGGTPSPSLLTDRQTAVKT